MTDLLAIVGGFGAAAQAASGLKLQRLGKQFVMLQEGAATEAQLGRAAKLLEGAADLSKKIELANEVLNYTGLVWGNVTFINDMMAISAEEASGSITSAEARRRRATAIGGAINNNGMFIAGNILKARAAAKQAKGKSGGAGGEPPPPDGTAVHEQPTPGDGTTTGETKPSEVTKPTETTPTDTTPTETGGTAKETTTPKEGGGTGETAKPGEGGGTVGESGGLTGSTKAGKTGGAKGTGKGAKGTAGEGGPGAKPGEGAPAKELTPRQRKAAASKALRDAAQGTSQADLAAAAESMIGQGTWKGDIKKALKGLGDDHRVAAEKALVAARDKLVNDTWDGIKKDYPGLKLENAGTKSFGSDIDATVRPETEATSTGPDMANQVKLSGEAAQRLSEALRAKVGGETDAQIDTNIYSFIGEGRVKASDPKSQGAQQHVDTVVGLAEQLRGQGDQDFKRFEQRLGKAMGDPRAVTEAKQLLAEARKFHDARQAEWKAALAKAKATMPKEKPAVRERAAREALLGQKKGELGQLMGDPAPDFQKIAEKQAEINWFAPDAYATPSAFKQAVAHGQRLKGTATTAGEMPGADIAKRLREAAAKHPPDSPEAQRLTRDAARVESQQRLLDMTVKELAAEQQKSPMDAARVKDLEDRISGLKDAKAKVAEPLLVADILGTTMPVDKPSGQQIAESAAASGANMGMLEAHVAHAKDIDGQVKAAAKYAGRIAMAEFLGRLKPDLSSTIGKLLGDFIQGRWGMLRGHVAADHAGHVPQVRQGHRPDQGRGPRQGRRSDRRDRCAQDQVRRRRQGLGPGDQPGPAGGGDRGEDLRQPGDPARAHRRHGWPGAGEGRRDRGGRAGPHGRGRRDHGPARRGRRRAEAEVRGGRSHGSPGAAAR